MVRYERGMYEYINIYCVIDTCRSLITEYKVSMCTTMIYNGWDDVDGFWSRPFFLFFNTNNHFSNHQLFCLFFCSVHGSNQLLGINIFTYILAAAIAFFLSMNMILGQGWLGNAIGLQGTGTFIERSEKLPNVVDLSEDQFSL